MQQSATHHGHGGESIYKISSRNCMICPDLHREIMFPKLNPSFPTPTGDRTGIQKFSGLQGVPCKGLHKAPKEEASQINQERGSANHPWKWLYKALK